MVEAQQGDDQLGSRPQRLWAPEAQPSSEDLGMSCPAIVGRDSSIALQTWSISDASNKLSELGVAVLQS